MAPPDGTSARFTVIGSPQLVIFKGGKKLLIRSAPPRFRGYCPGPILIWQARRLWSRGPIVCGRAQSAAEAASYASPAKTLADNTCVWFGATNELRRRHVICHRRDSYRGTASHCLRCDPKCRKEHRSHDGSVRRRQSRFALHQWRIDAPNPSLDDQRHVTSLFPRLVRQVFRGPTGAREDTRHRGLVGGAERQCRQDHSGAFQRVWQLAEWLQRGSGGVETVATVILHTTNGGPAPAANYQHGVIHENGYLPYYRTHP
jgi:hypothetical protein